MYLGVLLVHTGSFFFFIFIFVLSSIHLSLFFFLLPLQVANTMATIMAAHRPNATYKVGPDSAAAPIVGLLPTAIREFIVKFSMYKEVGST